jgi:membrane dipeptidase
VRRAEDIPRAKQAGKMAITFDLEGMNALADETYMVSLYYRLGVRQMLVLGENFLRVARAVWR